MFLQTFCPLLPGVLSQQTANNPIFSFVHHLSTLYFPFPPLPLPAGAEPPSPTEPPDSRQAHSHLTLPRLKEKKCWRPQPQPSPSPRASQTSDRPVLVVEPGRPGWPPAWDQLCLTVTDSSSGQLSQLARTLGPA